MWSDVAHASRWAGEAYVWNGQALKSIIATLRGAEIAKALDDKALQSHYLAIFSYLAGLIPLREASRRLLESGSGLLEGLANSRAELDFRRVASARHLNAASWELAKSQLDALIALSRQLGDEYALLFGLSTRTLIAFRQADETAFATFGPELHDRARRCQNDQFSRVYPAYRGIMTLRRGEVESAQRLLSEAEGFVRKSQDTVGRVLVGGPTAHCLLLQGKKEEARLRAQETLVLVESARFSMDSIGVGLSEVVEVYLSLWEAGSEAERQQLQGPLRRALGAMRRCAQIFPAIAPRALLWHGRDAWNQGAVWLARYLGQASRRCARRLEMSFDEALAETWLARFAKTPHGAAVSLSGEARGLFQLLTRGLGSSLGAGSKR